MKTMLKKPLMLLGLVVLALAALGASIAFAQALTQPVHLVDVQSNGTAAHVFRSPVAHFWNFIGGATYNSGTKAIDIGSNWAYDPVSSGAKPACTSGIRGQYFTYKGSSDADAGVSDITYQCLKAANNTYAWVTVVSGG